MCIPATGTSCSLDIDIQINTSCTLKCSSNLTEETGIWMEKIKYSLRKLSIYKVTDISWKGRRSKCPYSEEKSISIFNRSNRSLVFPSLLKSE